MLEASLQGVLKVLLIILFIYYALKFITRIFGPVLLKYLTKKAGEKIQRQFSGFQQDQNGSDDDVILNKKSNKKTSNKHVGEYIDFEEID